MKAKICTSCKTPLVKANTATQIFWVKDFPGKICHLCNIARAKHEQFAHSKYGVVNSKLDQWISDEEIKLKGQSS